MISIVVVARNEAEHIQACLQALLQQSTDYQLEIILVSNSTDKTNQLAAKYQKLLSLTIIGQDRPGRGAARAAGFALAKSDIILSTDGDSQVPTNWVNNLVRALKSDVVAVSGTCRISDCGRWRNWWFNHLQPQFMRLYRLSYGHYWLTGSNFGIMAAVYRQAGGFNPNITDVEDIDLGFRAANIGRIGMTTSCAVTTSGKRFKAGIVRGLLPYAKAFIGRYWLKQGNRYSRD